MAIPELMRILLDECGYGWDEAWKVVTSTIAYTNHTVMKEALECWSEDLIRSMLPRIYQITKEIDNRLRKFIWDSTGNPDAVERMAVISNGVVRMANLCVGFMPQRKRSFCSSQPDSQRLCFQRLLFSFPG